MWQDAQGTARCLPSRVNAAVLWKARDAVRQITALWHEAQSRPSAPRWMSSWQGAQETGSAYLTVVPRPAGKSIVSLRWHWSQGTAACLATKNSSVSFFFECVNFATRNEAASWQVSQRGESWPRWGS